MQNRKNTFDGQPIFLLGERACGVRGYNNIQDFYVIKKQCLDSGTLFEDPEFPLTGRWVRPKDICENPQFLVNKTSKFDVQRGHLSDYWFLSVVTSLTLNENLFKRVVCDDNSFNHNYAGIFHFRFWQYARWVDVVIDDRLPANGNHLINLQSTEGNEFWLPLLEKAYAKLYGSYESLLAGISCEAFEDFTGGVSEIYNLKNAPGDLYELMKRAFNRHSMITCLRNDGPNVANDEMMRIYAYSVTKVKSIEAPNKGETFQLLRLRNSSADETEWNKVLNDNSQYWSQLSENERYQLELTIENDDEFWISYKDFIKYFDRVDMCMLSPSAFELEKDSIKWDLTLFEGQWMKDFSVGGSSSNIETFHLNPQYLLTLKDPDEAAEGLCSVTITLIQKNRRIREATPPQFLTIGFIIYRVSELTLLQKPLKREFFETTRRFKATKFTNSRRVTNHYNLEAGNYLIVPSTFDPSEEGKFVLRVYSDNKHTLKEHDIDVEIKKINANIVEAQEVEKLFNDASNANQEVGWAELKTLLDGTIPKYIQEGVGNSEGFSRENCRSLVVMMDTNFSRKVKLEDFEKFYNYYNLWKSTFETFDKDGKYKLIPLEFRDALETVGYSFGARIIYSLIYQFGEEFNTVSYENFIMCVVKVKTLTDAFKSKNENQGRFTLEEWIMSILCS